MRAGGSRSQRSLLAVCLSGALGPFGAGTTGTWEFCQLFSGHQRSEGCYLHPPRKPEDGGEQGWPGERKVLGRKLKTLALARLASALGLWDPVGGESRLPMQGSIRVSAGGLGPFSYLPPATSQVETP